MSDLPWMKPHKFEPKMFQGREQLCCEVCGFLAGASIHKTQAAPPAPKGEDLAGQELPQTFEGWTQSPECREIYLSLEGEDDPMECVAAIAKAAWNASRAALRAEVANLSSRCESLQADMEEMVPYEDFAAVERGNMGLREELARERELNAELRQVVIGMRSVIDGALDIGFLNTERAALLVVKADLLLESAPKPDTK